jgi:hypothetical protein
MSIAWQQRAIPRFRPIAIGIAAARRSCSTTLHSTSWRGCSSVSRTDGGFVIFNLTWTLIAIADAPATSARHDAAAHHL